MTMVITQFILTALNNMKLKNLILASLSIAGVLAASSCKKDNAAEGIDKSLLEGQWVCTYEFENGGLIFRPKMLWDIDAAIDKVKMYFQSESEGEVVPALYSLEIKGKQFIIKQDSKTLEFDILTLDQTHWAFVGFFDDDIIEYHFTKMNNIILGTWAVSWEVGEEDYETRYYRFEEGGTGAWIAKNGNEFSKLKWSIEPARDNNFRFTFSILNNDLYENTLRIEYVFSDDELRGYDELNIPIYLDRMK